ncbi:MAG: UbiA family prenyltransferase [Verrucomicrobia bacterium]|nr:UbiA family prenyltransferase [Verrucomicrobiota bacterium]
MNPSLPLCVDLDGTLLATDCLWESFVQGLKQNPFIAFLVPFWLLRGKAYLKNRLARGTDFDVNSLPENPRFIKWLASQVANERDIYLVSASDQALVSAVADEFGIFKEAIGSSEGLNLRGKYKADYLVDRFGEGGFDYAGNDFPDLRIWEKSHASILVHPVPRLLKRVPDANRRVIVEDRPSIPVAFIKAMRPHQWMKNLLIFVPLLTAHVWQNVDAWVSSVLAFFSFSLCASAVYLINDLADLLSDRLHNTKRNRPFASGSLPLYYGLIGAPFLFAFGFLIMIFANLSGLSVLGVYMVATCLYSFWLKQVAGVDIVVLAGLYTLRLVLGGFVVEVVISDWLLAFSMFFFLSLAMVKRFSELYNIKEENRERVAGRAYLASDLNLMAMLGSCSGYLSVLVLALYVSSEHVTNLYRDPKWILLVCPVMLIWVTRLWLETHRGRMDEDPILFAIKDGFSYGTIVVMLIITLLASPI